jgi:hypothetical protein
MIVNMKKGVNIMKNWYESKTVWFNALAGLIMVAGYFGFGEFQPDSRVAELIGLVASLVNLYLRAKTNTALK